MFTGEGDPSLWEGAPVIDGAFAYRLPGALDFRGSFPGAQSAAGTLRFTTGSCDTGTESWTATTTATPPVIPGRNPGGTPGGNPGGSPGGTTGSKPKFATHVVFRKVSMSRLGGRIKSPSGACRTGRTVTLWRGQHRSATTRTKSDGTFSFDRSAKVRGRRVRVGAPARSTAKVLCEAGSSGFIGV
jgi:hypothetical protein